MLAVAGEVGFGRLLVLDRAEPVEMQVWESTGHFHMRVDYLDRDGTQVTLVQAEGIEDFLPVGDAVRVRGHPGVVNGRGWEWEEHGYVLSLAPGNGRLAHRLVWREVESV